jgi:nicotinamidase-related amidase
MQERVWERFLTATDKADLEGHRDRRVGVGTRPALLMIDLYRGVFGDRPNAATRTAWEALPAIQALLAAARAARLPVLHLTGLPDTVSGVPGFSEAAHRDYPSRGAGLDPAGLERWRHKYDIVPEVAPIAGEVQLRKASPSGFWGTPLVGQLTYLGVDTILVAGATTSGCVRASVVDGCTYRFRMQVVEECVFDVQEATHAINLFDMHQKYADVVSLDQALAYIRRQTAPESQPVAVREPALA